MWHQSLKAALVITFLTGGGIWLLIFGWGHVRDGRRLAQSPAVVEGRVVSSASHALARGGQSLTLVVEYEPAGHPQITREFQVDGGDYQAAVATGRARVAYLPEDPRISRVTKFATLPHQVIAGLGGIMILSGLFCLVSVLKAGRKK